MKYKLCIYKTEGSNKGNLSHEEFLCPLKMQKPGIMNYLTTIYFRSILQYGNCVIMSGSEFWVKKGNI